MVLLRAVSPAYYVPLEKVGITIALAHAFLLGDSSPFSALEKTFLPS